MPPMATPQVKRKLSELLDDDTCERQLLMDLCAAKLRYVNPPRPPKRRTEVPLLRSVLIVNAMKHLSSEMKVEKMVDSSTEDLSVDPGHFEGLPPLSELLTDIMLDPQPLNSNGDQFYPQQSASHSFNWSSTSSPHYSPITPVQPSLPSYLDPESLMETSEDEKTVHNLLPCTSVLSPDASHSSRGPWEPQADIIDSFLSDSSVSHTPSESLVNFNSDFTFQPPKNPLPSFTSLFDSTHASGTYSEQSQSSSLYSPVSTASSSFLPSTSTMNFPFSNFTSCEDMMSGASFSESDLEILAKTFSAKLPALSIEELVHALPQTSFTQQISQPSASFHVPSTLQNSSSSIDSNPAANTQCASYCRKDQPPPNVDEGSMVRVLVNL